MSNHTVSIASTDKGWWAKCSCRQAMTHSGKRWEADDWEREHLAQIERAKAALHRDKATRANTLAHFEERMNNPNIPASERQQWKKLHDELSRRPERVTPASPHLPGPDDVPLFD